MKLPPLPSERPDDQHLDDLKKRVQVLEKYTDALQVWLKHFKVRGEYVIWDKNDENRTPTATK